MSSVMAARCDLTLEIDMALLTECKAFLVVSYKHVTPLRGGNHLC